MTTEQRPSREDLEQALEAARAQLESLRDRSSDLTGSGAPEPPIDPPEAPASDSARLSEEIESLERSIAEFDDPDSGSGADVRH